MKRLKKFNEIVVHHQGNYDEKEFMERHAHVFYKDQSSYILYGRITNELYSDLHSIVDGTLEDCLKFYKIHQNNPKPTYDELFIVKYTEKKELLPQEEIDMILTSKKYNL